MLRRRWLVPVAALVVAVVPALAATTASASTHPTTTAVQSGGAAVHVHVPTGAKVSSKSGIAQETSSGNWSGYAADSGTYTSVSASWTQPAGTCTSRSAQYSSFWVGLDGYNDGSVEQDGTDTDCSSGKPVYYGWYETYPNPSYNFGKTVKAGDAMSASTTYEGSNKFKLVLSDATQGWSSTTTQTVSGVTRSSAEVIIEAPCCTSAGNALPLADFGTVHFTNSLVNGSAIGNTDPEQIYMTGLTGDTRDTVTALTGGEAFSGTWKAAN